MHRLTKLTIGLVVVAISLQFAAGAAPASRSRMGTLTERAIALGGPYSPLAEQCLARALNLRSSDVPAGPARHGDASDCHAVKITLWTRSDATLSKTVEDGARTHQYVVVRTKGDVGRDIAEKFHFPPGSFGQLTRSAVTTDLAYAASWGRSFVPTLDAFIGSRGARQTSFIMGPQVAEVSEPAGGVTRMVLFLNGDGFVEYVWSTSASQPQALARFLSDEFVKRNVQLVSVHVPFMRIRANTSLRNHVSVAHAIEVETMSISGEGVSFGGPIDVLNELNARPPKRRIVMNRPFWLRVVDPHKQTLFIGWFDDPRQWVSGGTLPT
jgi:hypothetical protein